MFATSYTRLLHKSFGASHSLLYRSKDKPKIDFRTIWAHKTWSCFVLLLFWLCTIAFKTKTRKHVILPVPSNCSSGPDVQIFSPKLHYYHPQSSLFWMWPCKREFEYRVCVWLVCESPPHVSVWMSCEQWISLRFSVQTHWLRAKLRGQNKCLCLV